MSPAVLPIAFDQGTVWRRSVSLRAGTTASSQPYDLTGCSIHAQIRETWNGPLLKEIAVTVTDAPGGLFDLVIDDRARTLRRFSLHWDLLVTAPDGTVTKFIEGPVQVRSTVTRPDAV
jgi:hypothetical protein